MEAISIPERPMKVKVAVYLLYIGLGVGVTGFVLSLSGFQVRWPAPFIVVQFFLTITLFHFQSLGLLLLGQFLTLLVAAWLYFMIGKGRNLGRVILLACVVLEFLVTAGLVLVILYIPEFVCYLRQPPFNPSVLMTSLGFHVLQVLLAVVAVSLLFAKGSSDWFGIMKLHYREKAFKSRE
jgi:hypothetical protein